LYALSGKSFHSNDSRVVIAQNGNKTAPTAIGTEIGVYLKPITNAFVNISIWQLQSQQEFVYVGDEAVVALGGASQRTGLDLSCRYSLHKNIIADVDFNFARAKDIAAAENENNIPLAPKYTSTGGLQYQNKYGLQASLRYRYLAERAANNTNTIKAIGYTLLDANIAWVSKKIRYQLSTENVLNTAWREAQFETETQLKQEKMPISEIHFTSGTPLMLTAKAIFMF
jgi:TonB dependent receptor